MREEPPFLFCRMLFTGGAADFTFASNRSPYMLIAVLTVEYTLHGNDSLKGKRRVANSLKQKVRNTFNVALAEAGTEESLCRLRLQVVSISNSERHLRSRMDKCLSMMEAVCPEEMTYSDMEIFDAD